MFVLPYKAYKTPKFLVCLMCFIGGNKQGGAAMTNKQPATFCIFASPS